MTTPRGRHLAATPLRPEVLDKVVLSLPSCKAEVRQGLARALAVACVREAHEECGLFLGNAQRPS